MQKTTFWQSLHIGGKIQAGLAILVIGYFVSMAFGFFLGLYNEKQAYDVEASMFPAAIYGQQAVAAFNNQITRYGEAVIAGDPDLLDTARQHALEAAQALDAIAALTGLAPEHREAVRVTLDQFRKFTAAAETVYAILSATSDDQDALETVADAQLQAAELAQQKDTLRHEFETMTAVFEETLKADMTAFRTRSQQNRYLNVAVFVGVVSLALIVVNRLITREISQPIRAIVDTAHAIAQGDLSQQLEFARQDEIGALAEAFRHMRIAIRSVLHETERLIHAVQAGQLTTRGHVDEFQGEWRELIEGVNGVVDAFVAPINVTATVIDQIATGTIPEPIVEDFHGEFNLITTKLNVMSAQLKAIVLNVKAASDTVAGSSNEIYRTSKQMSDGANQQAAAAEEVSSSMEEMSANIRQSADNAQQTEQIAIQSTRKAQESGRVVAEAVVAMQKIAQKITIIQDIADQTRMLSLNATIEAARAQEHGKAFSVVASEVRKLSDITKTAAEEINHLADSSLHISEKAGNMLRTLVPDIQQTADLVQEISAASSEQSIGTEQVNHAIQQLDQVTQQNAVTAEQMASTAEELANQARQLQGTIAFFQVS